MLARAELKGDPDTAVRLQKQFSVTPPAEVAVSPQDLNPGNSGTLKPLGWAVSRGPQ